MRFALFHVLRGLMCFFVSSCVASGVFICRGFSVWGSSVASLAMHVFSVLSVGWEVDVFWRVFLFVVFTGCVIAKKTLPKDGLRLPPVCP